MKGKLTVLAVLVIFNLIFTVTSYNKNLFAAEGNQQNIEKSIKEYLKQRLEYSQSSEYNPYNPQTLSIKEECIKLINNGQFNELVKRANDGLKLDKYNIQFLMDLAIAYRELGDTNKADEYRKLWTGLMDSIFNDCDGKSADTAFKVISVAEEYAVLGVLQVEKVEQKLVEIGDNKFDIFKGKNKKTGEKCELYFNVDIPMEWLTAHLSEKE